MKVKGAEEQKESQLGSEFESHYRRSGVDGGGRLVE
jgi:hypothetical protein